MKNKRDERMGLQKTNNYGSSVAIVKYRSSREVVIQYDDSKWIQTIQWGNFVKGSFKSPYCKTVYGIGFLGEGKYSPSDAWHVYWHAMFDRVYSQTDYYRRYCRGVSMQDNWHSYQIFAKWCEENHYEIDSEMMSLDKDILLKGNKNYSPETCIFVPQFINTIFIQGSGARGDLPIGVYYHKREGKYRAQCSITTPQNKTRKNKWLGSYDTPEQAFQAYKVFKEKYIKEVADYYKDKIPTKLYEALYNYEVEITD